MCPLCLQIGVKMKASLLHILCNCAYAMGEDKLARQSGLAGHIGRITWRHDSVLFAIFRGVLRVVNRYKKAAQEGKLGVSEQPNSTCIQFRSEANVKYAPVRVPVVHQLIAQATDWKLMFDMNVPEYEQRKERPFPPEIVPFAPNRPDGVIWSCSTKTVIWIELTSPWEENMTLRHEEKHTRYNQLKIDCIDNGWKVYPLCIEVGCRGHVSQLYEWMCNKAGLHKEGGERFEV